NLRHLDLGFAARNLVLTPIYDPMIKGLSEAQGKEFFSRVREATLKLPGVQSVSLILDAPASSYKNIQVETFQNADKISVGKTVVDNDYFETLEIRLLSGHSFDSGVREKGQRVAVINQAMAEKLWPGKEPIGETFRTSDPAGEFTVIGISAN